MDSLIGEIYGHCILNFYCLIFSFNCLFNSGIHKGRRHKGQLLDLSLLNRDARDFFPKIPDGRTVVYKTVCPYDASAVMPDISGQRSRPRCPTSLL